MADNCCIVALGDSLTEGFGVPPEGSFPARLDGLLRRRGTDCRVINMGRSGDTCRGVLARLSQVLALAPDLVILEIGLNDVLMGAMVERIELNISRIVERLTAARARVLLAGMVLPPMGEPDGESAFAGIYPRVAAANGVGLIPGFNAPAFTGPGRLQYDGLHPTSRGYEAITDHVLPWVVTAVEEAMTG